MSIGFTYVGAKDKTVTDFISSTYRQLVLKKNTVTHAYIASYVSYTQRCKFLRFRERLCV